MDLMEASAENSYNSDVYDPTSIDWNSFEWTNGFYPHKITTHEKNKPYLISYAYYGTDKYWDLILLVNKIQDIWEVVVGEEIRVPKMKDITSFILKYKK